MMTPRMQNGIAKAVAALEDAGWKVVNPLSVYPHEVRGIFFEPVTAQDKVETNEPPTEAQETDEPVPEIKKLLKSGRGDFDW